MHNNGSSKLRVVAGSESGRAQRGAMRWTQWPVLFGGTLGIGLCIVGSCGPGVQSTWTPAPLVGAARDDEPDTDFNVVRVNKFFNADPWLSFASDGSGRIDGVRFALYLESAAKARGVYGNGTIVVTMYRLDRGPDGRETPAKLHEWEFPAEKAYPFRAKKRTLLGWGYGFRLRWDPELEVAGKKIAFVVKYIREDGRVISSSRQVLKVPIRGAAAVS